jgi:Tfp pilus assembly protein PilN
MSRVNLLPREVLERQRTRKVTSLVAAVGTAALMIVALIYFLEVRSLSGVKSDVDAQDRGNAQLQAQVSGLHLYQDLQDTAAARVQLLDKVFAGEVSFSGLFLDLSNAIPTDADLTSLAINVGAPGQATAEASSEIVGSITFAGQGVSSDSVAAFTSRLQGVKGWANPYVTSVTKSGAIGTTFVQFAGTVDLTTGALTDRGARGAALVGSA